MLARMMVLGAARQGFVLQSILAYSGSVGMMGSFGSCMCVVAAIHILDATTVVIMLYNFQHVLQFFVDTTQRLT